MGRQACRVTRVRVDLDSGWMFARGRKSRRWLASGDGKGGAKVDLPHCWNAQDEFQEGVAYHRGFGSYTRSVGGELPGDGVQRLFWRLDAGGFYGTGDVWLNGRRLASVDGQYLGFSLELGVGALRGGDNTIGVRLTNRCGSSVLPGIRMPDFLLYGGLSGRVCLLGLPSLHLDDRAVQIRYEFDTPESVRATIDFRLCNRSPLPRHVSVSWFAEAEDGSAVGIGDTVEVALAPGHDAVRSVRVGLPDVRRWRLEDPALYRVVGRVTERGAVIDSMVFRTGFREAVFRPGAGFFLNGTRVDLRGCNRHESMPGFGRALPPMAHGLDARLIREAGLNFVRLSHYPQDPLFLHACDELGLLVYAEIASWKSVRGGRWLRAAERQMRGMIVRDRNHPSVILWGMGNESRSAPAYQRLGRLAAGLDPSRPVIYAENHLYRARRKRTLGLTDVWGCNYELDELESGRDGSRLGNVVVSECSNYPLARRGALEAEAAQVDIIERDLARLAGKPYVAGFALWCFNDYGTLRKRRYRRFSGIVDAWRLPKMSMALLRSLYADEPFVALFADWQARPDSGGAEERPVHVFSNCPATTLALNGRPVCSWTGRGHHVCRVAFERGELVASAPGANGVLEDRAVTAGPAVRIRLEQEGRAPAAGERSVVMVRVSVEDGEGRLAAGWSGLVSVAAGAGGRLFPYRGDGCVMISGGQGRTFVQLAADAEEVEVRGSHESLAGGVCALRRAARGRRA